MAGKVNESGKMHVKSQISSSLLRCSELRAWIPWKHQDSRSLQGLLTAGRDPSHTKPRLLFLTGGCTASISEVSLMHNSALRSRDHDEFADTGNGFPLHFPASLMYAFSGNAKWDHAGERFDMIPKHTTLQ